MSGISERLECPECFGIAGIKGFADTGHIAGVGRSGLQFRAETGDEVFEFDGPLQSLSGGFFVGIEECLSGFGFPFRALDLAGADFLFETLL